MDILMEHRVLQTEEMTLFMGYKREAHQQQGESRKQPLSRAANYHRGREKVNNTYFGEQP